MDRNSDNTALFTDSRDLATFTVSVTRIPGIGLVMKCGEKAGFLPELIDSQKIDCPLIISTRGYKDRSTRFVSIEGGKSHREYVVGITGFPFQEKPGTYRALPIPMEVIIVPTGTRIEKIPTNQSKHTATARTAFQTVKARRGTDSAIVAEGSNILVRGWEIFLPASNSKMPYFPENGQKDVFSVQNMVNAALRFHAKRLDEDPIGGEGQHFLRLNQILADEAVGDTSWKDKLLPAYTRKLAGNDAEIIVSRLAQKMREEGWSLTIDTGIKTLPLQAISPDGIIVASGQCLGTVRDRSYWKEIIVRLCDGLGFEAREEVKEQFNAR